jgi:hypothetical protein
MGILDSLIIGKLAFASSNSVFCEPCHTHTEACTQLRGRELTSVACFSCSSLIKGRKTIHKVYRLIVLMVNGVSRAASPSAELP